MEDSNFFKVVRKLNDLYITYRGRFVIAAPDRQMYIPHLPTTKGGEPVRLTNKYVIAHLNQAYAIAVYAGPHSSKFVCFDIDLQNKVLVRQVIDALVEFGFPRDRIYVSTSGGKGFHVEMFFTDTVYTNHLIDMYETVCAAHGFDRRKIEFRPTSKMSIKLPLSKHPKTGNICYYLDRETLEPIEDIEYILSIEQIDRDWVTDLIKKRVDRKMIDCPAISDSDHYKPGSCPDIVEFADTYPMITAPGTRNSLMTSIAVHERKRGTSQEDIEKILIDWAAKQNLDLVNTPWNLIVKHAGQLAKWVWGPNYLCVNRNVNLTENDLACILSKHARLQKRVLFLVIVLCRRHGVACMSAERMAGYVGCSTFGVKDALDKLEEAGLVEHEKGKKYYDHGEIKAKPNTYRYKSDITLPVGRSISLSWDFKEESFDNAYLELLRENVPRDDWNKYFTKKEIDELRLSEGEKNE